MKDLIPGKDTPTGQGLQRRLVYSHLIVAAVGIFIILVALVTSYFMLRAANHLALEVAPATEVMREIQTGVHAGQASLRGWISIRDPMFQEERREAWNRRIYPALAQLEELSSHEGGAEAIRDHLSQLRQRLADLEQWQWHIEDVAQAPGNRPAHRLMHSRLQPIYDDLFFTISTLIDLEKDVPVRPSNKKVLGTMADFRGHFSRAHGLLNIFLASGDKVALDSFQAENDFGLSHLAELGAYKDKLNPAQKVLLDHLEIEKEAYQALTEEVVTLRLSPEWNLAQHWLREHALPQAREVNLLLDEIAAIEHRLLEIDSGIVAWMSRIGPLIQLGALVLMIVVAWFMAKRGAQKILIPIRAVVEGSRRLASGELSEDIPVIAEDELGTLSRSFNTMRHSLQQQQAMLRDAEADSRAVIDTTNDGIITIDEHGTVLTINQAAQKILGFTSEEVIGQNVNMLMPSPDREQHDGYLANYLRTGNRKIIGFDREVNAQRKDGSLVPINLSVGETVRAGGERIFTGILRDISDLKAAEEELHRFNRELEGQNQIKTAIAELDDQLRGERDMRRLGEAVLELLAGWMNAQVGVMYRVQEDHLERVASHGLGAEEAKLRERIGIQEDLLGEAVREKQVRFVSDLPDGYCRVQSGLGAATPRHLMVAPVLFEGAVLAVIELAAIDRLAELESEHLETALEHVGISINSSIIYQQREAVMSRLEDQAAKLQNQQEELHVSNEELEEQTEALKASKAEMQSQQEELQVINEELEEQRVALVISKQALEAKNVEVEEKAVQVAEASRYKSEFLANMSHELRTPLNSLLIFARMLSDNKDGNLTDRQVEFASTIHDSGSDLLHLINDILDLSKVEAGRLELQLDNAPVDGIIADIRDTFQAAAEEKGLGLELMADPGLPDSLYTDSVRLNQVLKNFLSNALKFTEQGKVQLRICRPDESLPLPEGMQSDQAVAFMVRDEGIGIPADKQDMIFNAFQQADGSTSRRFGGTGLGLSISRELASLLGGVVHISSEEGVGSCFTLVIPERCSSAEPGETVVVRGVPASGAYEEDRPALIDPLQLSGRLAAPKEGLDLVPGEPFILVVEDDPKFSRILADQCAAHGWKFLGAKDGKTGLDYAITYRPTLILLDINLPEMDGFTVMQHLNAHPDTRDTPVHIISVQDQAAKARNLGAASYIIKPVSIEKLQQVFTEFGRGDERARRLLVVEDHAVQARSIQALFNETSGIEIEWVKDSASALERLAQQRFDCIILDLGLGGGENGYDILKSIQSDPGLSHPPVIVYTGQDLSLEQEQHLNQFAQSIIIKGVHSHDRLLEEAMLFLQKKESDLAPSQQQILHDLHAQDGALAGRTILLVDDDMRNVFALSSILEEHQFEVIVGRNGREGIELLQKNSQVDLVLMDIMMPEMDGYEAIRKIRAEQQYAKLPIIALTAKAMKGDRDLCIEAGASDYLSKPVEPDRLLSLIGVWLQQVEK